MPIIRYHFTLRDNISYHLKLRGNIYAIKTELNKNED